MFKKMPKGFGLILSLLLLLCAGVVVYNFAQTGIFGSSAKTQFPPAIQGLQLSQVISGPPAISMISKMHGSNITIKQGYIAQYGGGQSQIMIWVSESKNASEAKQLFDIMDKKIKEADQAANGAAGGPPFSNRRIFVRNGVNVVAVNGMGMENYYYQKGVKVYWIAAGGVDPLKTLDEYMPTAK